MSEHTEQVYELVQENVTLLGPDLDSAVCMGVIVASEWMDGDGKQWFTWSSAAPDGDHLASWRVRGFLGEIESGLMQTALTAGDDETEDE